MRRYKKGQISIFLCIILLSVTGLAALLVDISRISAGNALVNKAVRNSARSVLAQYNSRLKEDYGIFALSPEKCKEAEESLKKYLLQNLSARQNNGTLDLYDFRVEELSVTPVFNLSEDSIFKQQILEYMKYRAPKQLTEGFLDRFGMLGSFSRISEAYSRKVALDKLTGHMDKIQQKLKKNIDGTGAWDDKYVNSFNSDGSWAGKYEQIVEMYDKCRSLAGSAAQVEKDISALNSELNKLHDQIKNNESGDKNKKTNEKGDAAKDIKKDEKKEIERQIKEINDKLNVLNDRKSELYRSISSLNSSMNSLLVTLQRDLTEPYLAVNSGAAENVRSILAAGEKINSAISELEKYLADNFDLSNTYMSDFLKTTTGDINKIKELLPSGENAQSLLDKLYWNRETLSRLSGQLQTVSGIVSGTGQGSFEQISTTIYELLKGYDNKISYDYSKPERGNKKDDPRSGRAEAVKQFLEEKVLKDKNFMAAGFGIKELPSVSKLITGNFDKEDEEFLNGKSDGHTQEKSFSGVKSFTDSLAAEASSKTLVAGAENKGSAANDSSSNVDLRNNIDLYNEEGMFQEDVFSSIGTMLSRLSLDAKTLRDNVYINEYIMGVFKNAVPKLKEGSATVDDVDIHGISKKSRNTFYDYEVEYILHGNPSQNANKALTAGQLLLIRFGLDTLHVYTDPRKKELAAATAAALAGWWTGGAGIPVLSNLIMCGWGMGEALIDVRDLYEGRKVPVIKSEGDWKLDIGLAKGGRKTDPKLAFSYHDYLRLFLMVMDEKNKLGRMEDLIQLNIGNKNAGFKIKNCNTYIRVEAVVSMKYLFATQPFMPAKFKTTDGRHKFRVLVYEGY